MAALGNNRDGPVGDACRHSLETDTRDPLHNISRQRGGRDVDVSRRLAKERVADCTADHARLLTAVVEHREQVSQRRFAQPCRRDAQPLAHFV